MNKIDPNAPAFPAMDMNNYEGVDRLELRHEGLSIRAHFAGLAVQGLCANATFLQGCTVQEMQGGGSVEAQTAECAMLTADALLAALNKEGEGE